MQYKTELHLHTSDVSRCAKMTPEQVVDVYVDAGYSTVVLTNHYAEYGFDAVGSWESCIERYLNAVRRMREHARGRLIVLSGAEVRTYYNSNDFLLYGATEDFLKKNKYLHRMPIKELSALARANDVLLVQAHPFRNGMTLTDPKLLDGIEVFNGTPNTESRNCMANVWAKQFGLLRTSGSDFHGSGTAGYGGILTDAPIKTQEDLRAVLRSASYSLLCTGPSAERDGMTTEPAKY